MTSFADSATAVVEIAATVKIGEVVRTGIAKTETRQQATSPISYQLDTSVLSKCFVHVRI